MPENYKFLPEGIHNSVTILHSRETNIEALRNKIIKENNLHYDDMIDYEIFHKLHQNYAPNMSELLFAINILSITEASFQGLKYGDGRSRILLDLKLPDKDEMAKIRNEIIINKNLHIRDKIGYIELQKLHQVYGGIMSLEIFAIEVLLMDKQGFGRLRTDYEKNKDKKDVTLKKAFLLFNYEISFNELENLKLIIKKENNLENPVKLTYKQIEELYNRYGGVMTMNMFVRDVLGVSEKVLENVRSGRRTNILVSIRQRLKDNEINELKRYLVENLSEGEIAKKMNITVAFLKANIRELVRTKELSDSNLLYERVKILKESGFRLPSIAAELDISEDDVRMLLERYKEEKVKNATEESIRKKEEKSKRKIEKNSELIEKRAIKIMDEYINTEKNENAIKEYIQDCKRKFAEDKFEFEDLDFLRECILFVQGGLQEIEIFSRICIRFGEYENALKFIRENIMHNEKITFEEKGKLEELKKIIVNAENKLKAKKMLQAGHTDINEVAIATGASRSDVENLKKELISNVLFLNKFNTSPDDMDEYSNR